jgi:hypothetical protein
MPNINETHTIRKNGLEEAWMFCFPLVVFCANLRARNAVLL